MSYAVRTTGPGWNGSGKQYYMAPTHHGMVSDPAQAHLFDSEDAARAGAENRSWVDYAIERVTPTETSGATYKTRKVSE